MARECSSIADDLGYQVPLSKFPFMAAETDAAEFAKIEQEATCLAAMSWTSRGEISAYHTPRDTFDAVDIEAVRRSIEVGIQFVLTKDMVTDPAM